MFWKKAGLLSIVLAALAIVAYAQTSTKQRAHSANLQVAMAPGYLGVDIVELGTDKSGVEITRLAEESPAAKAGLRLKDVILEVNAQKVEGKDQFRELIAGKAPGTKITLTVVRGGAKQALSATLGARPQEGLMIPAIPVGPGLPMSPEDLQAMIAGDAPRVGFEGESITAQMAEFFGVAQGEGVLVRTVGEKTPAEKAGLKAGDIVTKVNGMPVATPREIAGIVRQSKKVTFTVVRNRKEMTLNLEIAWNTANPFDRDPVN